MTSSNLADALVVIAESFLAAKIADGTALDAGRKRR
jgi:hypothetical protein